MWWLTPTTYIQLAGAGSKIQGQTVPKPVMLVADFSRVFEAAQAYVMLSRVQELQQLVVIDCVQKEKMYPSEKTMAELERMKLNMLNSNTHLTSFNLNLVSVNIRSLRKHIVDFIREPLRATHCFMAVKPILRQLLLARSKTD